MLQVGPILSFLNLKIGLPPVLKAGSSGTLKLLKWLKVYIKNVIYQDTFVGKFQTDFGTIYRHPGDLFNKKKLRQIQKYNSCQHFNLRSWSL